MASTLPTITIQNTLASDQIELEAGKHTIIQLDEHFGRDTMSQANLTGEFTIRMAPGVRPEDVLVLFSTVTGSISSGPGGPTSVEIPHWQLRVKGSSDAIDFNLSYTNQFDALPGLRGIEFSDGTVWTAAQVMAQLRQADHARDALYGSSGSDLLQGDAKGRRLLGFGGDDTLVSGTGNDQLTGGQGNDVFRFGPDWGQDVTDWTAGDSIEFGAGVTAAQLSLVRAGRTLVIDDGQGNVLTAEGYFDSQPLSSSAPVIRFADGSHWSDDHIRPLANDGGSSGNDFIVGTDRSERINGRGGDDQIVGGGGSDTLVGGAGADSIDVLLPEGGVTGSTTTVQFQPGFGDDQVSGFNPALQQLKLEFLGGIQSSDLVVYRTTEAGVDSNSALFRFKGTKDSVLVFNFFAATGTAGAAASVVFSDGVSFSPDQLAQQVSGRVAQDYLYLLQGTAGNDTLTAGLFNTSFHAGGGGNDTLLVASPFLAVSVNLAQVSADERDTVRLLDVTPADVTGYDTAGGGDGTTVLLGKGALFGRRVAFSGLRAGGQLHAIDLVFADGTVWNEGQIEQRMLAGMDGVDDSISLLDPRAETLLLNAGRGHDVVSWFQSGNAAAPDDLILASSKDLTFSRIITPGRYVNAGSTSHPRTVWEPGYTDVVIKLTATGDSLTLKRFDVVQGGTSRIVGFADGTGLTSGDIFNLLAQPVQPQPSFPGVVQNGTIFNDTLAGTAGDDTLIGGAGDDVLNAGAGHDTVVFNLGDGRDFVKGEFDTLKFGAGLKAADLQVSGKWLFFKGLADGVYLTDGVPQNIVFADGTRWSGADLQALQFLGSQFNDDIVGDAKDNVIFGQDGGDLLTGGLGRDTLVGGAGNDVIFPGVNVNEDDGARNVIIFNRGDGHDQVWAANDILQLGAGLTRENLRIAKQEYGGLLISFTDTSDTIELMDAPSLPRSTIALADGSVISDADLARLLSQATAGDDILNGSEQADVLDGLAGNDWLLGNGGNDTLSGGLGADTLDGGAGNDTYRYNKGDGNDLVLASGADTIVLGGLKKTDVTLARVIGNTDAVALVINGSGNVTESLVIGQMSQWSGLTVRFSDGSTYTGAQLTSGSSGKLFGLGKGQDDVVTGGSGNDVLRSGSDLLGTNLFGGAGNDLLQGSHGTDSLSGDAGNDTLAGGAGADSLVGGKGADTYLFNRGDGRDLIIENDTSLFNTLLSPDLLKVGDAKSNQLWLTKSGNNLDIAIIGTQDHVVIQDWYKGSNYQVEKITALGDNKSLSASKVNALVTAMAKFSAPAEGTTTLPAATQTALNKILASSWS